MSWSYRIIDHGDHLALHKVHYVNDRPVSYISEPVSFVADPEEGPTGIRGGLWTALRSVMSKPVLVLTDFAQPSAAAVQPIEISAATAAPGVKVKVTKTGPGEDIKAINLDEACLDVGNGTLRIFDPARYLNDPVDARHYIEAAMEGDGPDDDKHLLGALKDVIRSGALERPRIETEPEIRISWSKDDKAWLARVWTDGAPEPNAVADGRTPSLALDALMEKRFLLGSDLF